MSPVALPSGVLPAPVQIVQGGELVESRVTAYRIELLDRDEALIGNLDGVTGGDLDWTLFTAIKGGGSLNVEDRSQSVDWLNTRVRPVVTIKGAGGALLERPAGVFIPAAPVAAHRSVGRSWKVELLDKCSILDTDTPSDANGNPVMFVAPIGSNVIATVVDLLEQAGEQAPAIVPDATTLTASMTWEIGTSTLTIINELLEAAGYGSLTVDGAGQFQATKYLSPSQRTPIYDALAPFVAGDTSVLSPEWDLDEDIYKIPNRYIAVSQGDGDAEALVAVATNEDPTSRFSFQSRGRWITETVRGVEVTSQAALDARAKMGLSSASSVAKGIKAKHLYLPDLTVGSVIRFRAADVDGLCYVTKTSLPLDPLALCTTELQEAIV